MGSYRRSGAGEDAGTAERGGTAVEVSDPETAGGMDGGVSELSQLPVGKSTSAISELVSRDHL